METSEILERAAKEDIFGNFRIFTEELWGGGSNSSSLVWLTTSTLISPHTKKIASKNIDSNSEFEMK